MFDGFDPPHSDEGGEELEDSHAESQVEFYDGFHRGYDLGFDTGLEIGRSQGYDDCLYRIKRFAESKFDPDLDRALKMLTGED